MGSSTPIQVIKPKEISTPTCRIVDENAPPPDDEDSEVWIAILQKENRNPHSVFFFFF